MASKRNQRQGCLFDCGRSAEPVLISACLLGIPCRWHGRRPKKREALVARLKTRYVLVPVCPEHVAAIGAFFSPRGA